MDCAHPCGVLALGPFRGESAHGKYGCVYIYTSALIQKYVQTSKLINTHIHALEILVHSSISDPSTAFFLVSTSPYLHVPSFTARTLASRSINTLNFFMQLSNLRSSQNWFIMVLERACLPAASPVPGSFEVLLLTPLSSKYV